MSPGNISRIITASFCGVLLSCAAPGQVAAQTYGPLDGLWFGGLRIGGGQASVEARFHETVGEVKTSVRNLPDLYQGDCIYVLRHQDGQVTESQLAVGMSNADCPRDHGFAFTTAQDGTLTLTSTPALPEFALSPVMTPPIPDSSTPPESFDVLGVSPGMTLEQIEQILVTERGWTAITDRDLEFGTDGWTSLSRLYVKDPEARTQPFETLTDAISVGYAAREQGQTGPDTPSVMIMREMNFPETGEGAVSSQTLADALAAKYGVVAAPDVRFSNSRFYDRAGTFAPEATRAQDLCHEGGGTTTWEGYGVLDPRSRPRNVSAGTAPDCGFEVHIAGLVHDGVGNARQRRITLFHNDILIGDLWQRQALDLKYRVENIFGSAAPVSEKALPEL